ncbi:hypothetical protein TNCV_3539101 [Trichonephila clavipes]|nr:hypothetical protein TNCV_3539101 [Trichonephila clavipes]
MSHCSAIRELLATDHVILNHGQVTWMAPDLAADHVILNHGQVTWTTPELAPSSTTPHQLRSSPVRRTGIPAS